MRRLKARRLLGAAAATARQRRSHRPARGGDRLPARRRAKGRGGARERRSRRDLPRHLSRSRSTPKTGGTKDRSSTASEARLPPRRPQPVSRRRRGFVRPVGIRGTSGRRAHAANPWTAIRDDHGPGHANFT
jgi:hypothetical protein